MTRPGDTGPIRLNGRPLVAWPTMIAPTGPMLFPGTVCYVWHAGLKSHVVAADLEAAGFDIRSQIIWRKQHFALSRGNYHWAHEPAWYAVRAGATANWQGDRAQ